MIDVQRIGKAKLFQEFDEGQRTFWFDCRTKKFLHNIDSFYYSVKLCEDFTFESRDPKVLAFRREVDDIHKKVVLKSFQGNVLQFYVDGMEDYLNVSGLRFANYYSFCLEQPDQFDIFMAPVVPGGSGDGSVTSEIIVQIRAAMLWELGAYEAFERSYAWVLSLCDQFGFNVLEVKENRTDFCWHTNYLEKPEEFFSMDNLYKMRVDRYSEANYHTVKKGSEGYEVDYIAIGRRGGRCFIRIYSKAKEVIEKNYKPFFFQTWLYHGLINRYDLYVFEEAFRAKNWHYTTIARLKFYIEHGSDPEMVEQCQEQIEVYERAVKITDSMIELAELLTPDLNLIYNIEFQLMRKASKSYQILPLKANDEKGPAKRIYDFLDNRRLITDYLTSSIFRLVEKTGDSNKSRRPDCGFWIALRRTKMVDAAPVPEHLKMKRKYERQLNAEIIKKKAINAAITYSLYVKGENDDNPVSDIMLSVLRLNDNDIYNAKQFKQRKIKQLSKDLLSSSLDQDAWVSQYDFHIVDGRTGEFFDDAFNDPEDDS